MSNNPSGNRPTATKFVTTSQGVSLNIRSAPNTTASILSKLPRGSQVNIYTDGINNGFAQLVDPVAGQIGYVSMQFLADVTPVAPTIPVVPSQPVTPTTPTTPVTPATTGPVTARPGLHIVGSAINNNLRDKLVASVKACYDAGRPYGAVVVVDNPAMANELAKYTTVVMRDYAAGNTYSLGKCQTPDAARAHAAQVYAAHSTTMKLAPNVQYFQLHNEDGVSPDFELETMRLAEADNRHIGLFGYSVGTPEIPVWQSLVPVLRHAMANGHVVILHQYGPFVNGKVTDQPVSSPNLFEYFGGRHRSFYASVPADCRPKLIIGETGPSDAIFRGAAPLVADQRAYIGLLRADPYVIGACPFTFGPSYQNAAYELNGALGDYEAFTKSI